MGLPREGIVTFHGRELVESQEARSLCHRIDDVVVSARRKCRDLFNKRFSPSCSAINVPVVSLPFGGSSEHAGNFSALWIDVDYPRNIGLESLNHRGTIGFIFNNRRINWAMFIA